MCSTCFDPTMHVQPYCSCSALCALQHLDKGTHKPCRNTKDHPQLCIKSCYCAISTSLQTAAPGWSWLPRSVYGPTTIGSIFSPFISTHCLFPFILPYLKSIHSDRILLRIFVVFVSPFIARFVDFCELSRVAYGHSCIKSTAFQEFRSFFFPPRNRLKIV